VFLSLPPQPGFLCGHDSRVHSSGGKARYGQVPDDVNRYLKWAYVVAAHAVCLQRRFFPHRHTSLRLRLISLWLKLYDRTARRKGHQKALGRAALSDLTQRP